MGEKKYRNRSCGAVRSENWGEKAGKLLEGSKVTLQISGDLSHQSFRELLKINPRFSSKRQMLAFPMSEIVFFFISSSIYLSIYLIFHLFPEKNVCLLFTIAIGLIPLCII